MRLIFRPLLPEDWPGDRTSNPDVGRFSAPWGDTLDLLEREVRALVPRHTEPEVVLQVAAKESAMRLDGGIRSDAKVTDHAVIVSFDSKHGPLRYACDRFTHTSQWRAGQGYQREPGWKANVRAVALGLEALRKVDRYGIARDGQQYRGWNQLGSGTPMPSAMTVEQAAALLVEHADTGQGFDHFTPGELIGNKRAVDRCYIAAVKRAHPDVGGDPDLFRRLTAARALLTGR